MPSLYESDRRIERFGAHHGIPVLALAPPLGDYAASHHIALAGPPGRQFPGAHWNELGHELVASVLTDALLADSPTVRTWTRAGPGKAKTLAAAFTLPHVHSPLPKKRNIASVDLLAK